MENINCSAGMNDGRGGLCQISPVRCVLGLGKDGWKKIRNSCDWQEAYALID